MTTIAYRSGEIAADTLATWGSNRDGAFVKVAKRGPFLAGASGSVGPCIAFLDWFRLGAKGDLPAMPDGDRSTFGLIMTPDGYALTYGPHGWERVKVDHYAMGSGADFATGALAMGADARRAVEVAALFDTKTGGEITVLRRD